MKNGPASLRRLLPGSRERGAPPPGTPDLGRPGAPRPADERSTLPVPAGEPARAWNLWELERLAATIDGPDSEERSLLLLHLREFAEPAGNLPREFDPLVREAFGADLAEFAG